MSTNANRTRGAVPTKLVAAAAALAMLAAPLPAAAGGSSRTVLLTLTGSTSLSQLAESVSTLGGRVVETLGLADSLLVELPSGVTAPTGATEVPDVAMKVNSTRTAGGSAIDGLTYRETIGLDDTRADLGAGVTVALVDTGVAETSGLGAVDHVRVDGITDTDNDGYGHGTFLAGIINGTGTHEGVAPAATVLDVKVAGSDGETSLSKVLQGLELAAEGDADVVNLSLSSGSPLPPAVDPLALALERLWSRGVVVVVAAGNDGPDRNTVSSPGNDPIVLTAGALDESGSSDRDDDSVADFSARGAKHSGGKPDLVAPGVSVVSIGAPGSYAESQGKPHSEGYIYGSGTSMAAAVTSGAVAALLAENPRLSPNGVKALLMGTTYTSADLEASDGAGAGGLDLGAALDAAAKAPVSPAPPDWTDVDGDWGPAEGDEQAWEAFAEAWESGDFAAVRAAWDALSWQTQQWASRMWVFAVVAGALNMDEHAFEARSWAARSWAFDGWLARSWAARSWAARSWAYDEWLARSWAGRSWAARSWAARSWAVDEWLARSWAARSWAARSWAARSWAARSWAARSWADDEWAARSWAARSWATESWDAASWSMAG